MRRVPFHVQTILLEQPRFLGLTLNRRTRRGGRVEDAPVLRRVTLPFGPLALGAENKVGEAGVAQIQPLAHVNRIRIRGTECRAE